MSDPSSPDGDTVKVDGLRELRERKSLSLRAAATQLEVHHSTLGRYEDGEYEPQASAIARMVEVYGEPAEAILAAVKASRPTP